MHAEIYDPKSRFQEWAQSARLGTPRYVTVASTGPDHAKVFEVEVRIHEQTYGIGFRPEQTDRGSDRGASGPGGSGRPLSRSAP